MLTKLMNIFKSNKGYTPWGKSIAIDLHGCSHAKVSSEQSLRDFMSQVVKVVNMVAHGPCYIDRFGDPKSNLEGYSAMQFIETSSITVHCDEVNDRAFVDIFSCKDFDSQKAEEFTKHFFEAKEMKSTSLSR